MKFVHVLLSAACLVACAHALPGGRRDYSFEDDLPDFFNWDFADTIQRIRDMFTLGPFNSNGSFNIPEGANTTSTVKVIDGHVVTINETTYSSGDENGNTAFRIRIVDVQPQNETPSIDGDGANTTSKTTEPENAGSPETMEVVNNEIAKNGGDTLNA